MGLVHYDAPVHRQVFSVVRARCECGARVELAYEWGAEGRGVVDPEFAARQLTRHAREHPILHPRIFPTGVAR